MNFVKGSALNTHLFKRLCQDMDAAHETLIFHTAVRWLSKGNVAQRVLELTEEISLLRPWKGNLKDTSQISKA